MSPRIVLTMVLLGLCAMLGAGLYYAEHRQSQATPALKPLSALSAQAVRCIRIQPRDREEIDIVRSDRGRWLLSHPIQAPALEQRILSILSILQTPVSDLGPVTAETRTRLGLAPAMVQLWLDEARFEFGTTESLYARRYVLYAGHIHLMDDYLVPQLMQPAGFFADTEQYPEANADPSTDQGPEEKPAPRCARHEDRKDAG